MQKYSPPAGRVGLRDGLISPRIASQSHSQSLLVQAFILLATLWAGILFGVDFIATPAKFLSPIASLPIEIDIGRRTFGVFNRVEDLLAALLLSVTIAMPRVRRRRKMLLLLPIAIFAIKSFWIWPILDLDAIRVVAGLPSTEENLHSVYVGLVIGQVALLLSGSIGVLRRTRIAIP